MTEGGFYQPGRARTTSIAIVVLMHGAAITALALSKMEVIPGFRDPPDIIFIPNPPTPPPEPADKVESDVKPHTEITYQKPIVPIVIDRPSEPDETFIPPRSDDFISTNGIDPGPQVDSLPPPEPVRMDARIDPRSQLQPSYPASEQRMGAEGSVALRVLIGTDGRVKSAKKVRATNDAFYQATIRHALRNWRFKPATLDGRPVESEKLMTVRFELNT